MCKRYKENCMKSSKKLIMQPQLQELSKLRGLGVPIKKLLKDHDLDMTSPTLVKLLDDYDEMREFAKDCPSPGYPFEADTPQAKIHASLFPEWLNIIDGIQVQPKEWIYRGKWPKGNWIKRANLSQQ